MSYDGQCLNITLYNGTTSVAFISKDEANVTNRVSIWCNGTVQIKNVNCYDSGSYVLVVISADDVADAAIVLHTVSGMIVYALASWLCLYGAYFRCNTLITSQDSG